MTISHTFSWQCPVCKTVHGWTWDKEDVPIVGQTITMHCPACDNKTFMSCVLVRAAE